MISYSPGAGSDHMSWHRAGFSAIFATEGDPSTAFNPHIHTAEDRIDLKDGEFSFEVRIRFEVQVWVELISNETAARVRVCQGGGWICGRVGGMGGLGSREM